MARSVAMTLELRQQLPDRSIIRNRIRHRNDSLEEYDAVLVALDDRSAVRLAPVGVLDVVEALGVSLPHVDRDALDRAPLSVLHCANSQ